MNRIFLEPGDPKLVFGADSNGSLIDAQWRDQEALNGIGPCIELVSMHQGMKQQMTTDVSNSARTSGRPVITEFTCVKYVDRTSVKLYEMCLRAQPLDTAGKQPTRLHLVRQEDDQLRKLMTIELRSAIISEIQLQTHPNDMPTEQFKLNFTEIMWFHTEQQRDGTDAPLKRAAGWSLARNRPITAFT